MRHTSTIKSKFWIAGTGREVLRQYGRDTHHVMLYLITGPMSSLDGLYWLPLNTISAHTGLQETEVSECLKKLDDIDFCRYDEKNQIVWVRNAAKHNLGSLANRADNRVKSALAHLDALPVTPLLEAFKLYYVLTEGYREAIAEAPPYPKPIAHLNHPDAEIEKNPDLGAKKSGGRA